MITNDTTSKLRGYKYGDRENITVLVVLANHSTNITKRRRYSVVVSGWLVPYRISYISTVGKTLYILQYKDTDTDTRTHGHTDTDMDTDTDTDKDIDTDIIQFSGEG